MNPLRIEQMTIFDVEPAEVVTIAAELEVPAISLFAVAGMDGARPVTAANKAAVLARLRDAPVAVESVEVFVLGDDPATLEAEIALAAELGARSIVAINIFEPDVGRTAAKLAALCELAGRYGLLVSLEFISMGTTRTPAEALAAVRGSGAANARITVDLLHVIRTGTPIAEIAALDPALIGSAQICDGPHMIDPALLIEEAGYERGIPGTGSFPLADFLAALPPTVSLGVEVPLRRLRESGVPARERTRRVIEATRAIQRRTEAGPHAP